MSVAARLHGPTVRFVPGLTIVLCAAFVWAAIWLQMPRPICVPFNRLSSKPKTVVTRLDLAPVRLVQVAASLTLLAKDMVFLAQGSYKHKIYGSLLLGTCVSSVSTLGCHTFYIQGEFGMLTRVSTTLNHSEPTQCTHKVAQVCHNTPKPPASTTTPCPTVWPHGAMVAWQVHHALAHLWTWKHMWQCLSYA